MATPRRSNAYPLILLHLLIAVPLAFSLNIWADEGSTLYTTQNGIGFALQNAADIERQAPLYFWLMALWREISGSIFFARVFSILCSVIAIRVFAGLAQRFLSWRGALLATAFFALHPVLIWASVEIRVYALVILLSVVLLRLFYEAFFDPGVLPERARRLRVWFVVLATIGLYTNYYLGFLLAGCFAGLLMSRRWRAARDYLFCMAITAAAVSPLALVFRAQLDISTSGPLEARSLGEGLREIWGHVLTFVLPADMTPGDEITTASLVRLWIVRTGIVVLGVLAFVKRRDIKPQTAVFAGLAATIVLFLLAAYFSAGTWSIALRHATVLFAPLILLLASLLSDLFSRDEKRAMIAAPVAGVLVLASFSYALMTMYPNMAKRGDWARVGSYIQQNERPGQPVVVFHTYDALALPYHYSGVNRILPDKSFFDLDLGTPTDARIRDRTAFTISEIPGDAAEIWLIENEECELPRICDAFNAYIRETFDIVDEKPFYMNRLQLLRRKVLTNQDGSK